MYLIEYFEKYQLENLGYLRYKVRIFEGKCFIEAYTKSGLFIKHTLRFASERMLNFWIANKIIRLEYIVLV